MKKKDIEALILWYETNKRDLPWRHTKDPYKIWISETMLQQTRVDTVIPYYERFLKEIPDLKALANVDEDRLLKLWEGLGYYSRARNLQKTAQILQSQNQNTLPIDKLALQSLPGIGPYTVGAILSIAYGLREPAIDGNVLRVLSRVYEEKESILKPKVRAKYDSILQKWMKDFLPSSFTQSFIELGALICTKTPQCKECPLNQSCKAYKHQTIDEYPVKKETKEKRILHKTVFLFEYKKKIGITKRENRGILANLYEFPNIENSLNEEEINKLFQNKGIYAKKIIKLQPVKHVFSHQIWILHGYQVLLDNPIPNVTFVEKKEVKKEYSLPVAFQKVWQSPVLKD